MRIIFTALISMLLGCAHANVQEVAPEPVEPSFMKSEATGAPIRWKKDIFPIVLIVHPDLEPWWSEIYVAASFWNTTLQERLFVFDLSTADVLFNMENINFIYLQPGDPRQFPHTIVSYDGATGQIGSAPIFLPPNTSYRVRFRVVVHELGHAIGLDHDPDNEDSVMHPMAIFGPFEITPSDRAELKSWYFKPEDL